VDQVSRPLLVVLLAVVVVAASWMAFLRPRAVESTTAEITAPARVATQAAKAAAATDKASAATDAASNNVDESSAAPAPAAAVAKAAEKAKAKAAAPAPAAKPDEPKKADADVKGQAAVLQAMDAGKVVVLLFFDKTGADDRAARDSVSDLNLRDGKVVVQIADVSDVGLYDSVTQGVTVTQSPTTMVISSDGKARVVNGLTDPTEVDQLVRAALQKK
jgi:hypothetical protein